MQIKIIGSSSSGNSTFIKIDNDGFLLDAGVSFKKLNDVLLNYGFSFNQIKHIFITHEHLDHVKGLCYILKKTNANLYLTKGTLDAICKNDEKLVDYIKENKEKVNILSKNLFNYDDVNIKDITIKPFLLSHDAIEPVGYIIENSTFKICFLTDTGYIPQQTLEKVKNCTFYLWECNHDIEMLMISNRPDSIKKRILSDKGHLSNLDSLHSLKRVIGNNTKYVFFGHISQECNSNDIIRLTKNILFNKYNINDQNIKYDFASEESDIINLNII